MSIQVAVQQQGATSRGSTSDPRDIRTLTVDVTPRALSPQGVPVSGTAGTSQTLAYATFTAAPAGSASDYTVTVNFGDGTSGAGTVVTKTGGGYNVVAAHAYANAGSYTTHVTILGPGASVTTTSTATVAAAPSTGGGSGSGSGSGSGATAPHVVDLIRRGRFTDPTRIDIVFSGPLDPASAKDVNNYLLFGAGRDHKLGTGDDLRDRILSATYDAATNTVTLAPKYRLNWFDPSKLVILSGTQHAVLGATGLALDGNNDGVPGGPYVATFARGVYVERPQYRAPVHPVAHVMGQPSTSLQGSKLGALFSPPASSEFREAFASLPASADQRVTGTQSAQAVSADRVTLAVAPPAEDPSVTTDLLQRWRKKRT